jgi:uncharacterized membrane protein
MGWLTWLAVISVATIVSFIIAEVIPFFDDLLSISSSLFISGFTFYFPPMMWVLLLREGSWFTPKNMALAAINLLTFLIGLVTLVAGTYASVDDIVRLPRLLILSGGSGLTKENRSSSTAPARSTAFSLAAPQSKVHWLYKLPSEFLIVLFGEACCCVQLLCLWIKT